MPEATPLPKELEEYFSAHPANEKIYRENLLVSFKANPGLDMTLHSMIQWHASLVQDQLLKPVRKLFDETFKKPTAFRDSKEFKECAKRFSEIVAQAFKKNDGLQKVEPNEKIAKWMRFAGAFLAEMRAETAKFNQEKRKSYSLYVVALLTYTASVLSVVNEDLRGEEGIQKDFSNATDLIVRWIGTTGKKSTQELWGV